jgi:hypothetical protein
MDRSEMLATLDDLHGSMVFVKKYSSDGDKPLRGANFEDRHMEALRQAILELKRAPAPLKVVALEGDDSEAIATTEEDNG